MLSLTLSDFSPFFNRETLEIKFKTKKNSIPIIFCLDMIFLIDHPAINNLIHRSLTSYSNILQASLGSHILMIPMFHSIFIEIKWLSTKPQSESSHYFISPIFFWRHIIRSISPAHNCDWLESLFKLLTTLNQMLIPLLHSFISFLIIWIT